MYQGIGARYAFGYICPKGLDAWWTVAGYSRFHFNEQDLMLNRVGQLSGRQRLQLLWQAAGYGVLFLGLAIMGPLIGYGALQSGEFGSVSWQMGCVTLLFLFGFGWLGWALLARLAEAALGKNEIVVGPVQLQYRGSGRYYRLYYAVHGLELPVGYKAYYTLVEGLTYQVHYTRWSKEIVSIEPVGKG